MAVAALALLVAVLVMVPAHTLADCQPAGPIQQALATAPVAFVGTVVAVDGPVARFAVMEVWAGDVGDTVEVRGLGDGGPDTGFGPGFSEDDRHWTRGATYLVVPIVDGGVLRDHLCTATTEWRAELAALRPAGARIVEAAAPEPPTALFIVGAAVLVLCVAAVLAFRRR